MNPGYSLHVIAFVSVLCLTARSPASNHGSATGLYTVVVKTAPRGFAKITHADQPLDLRKSKFRIEDSGNIGDLNGQVRFKTKVDKQADRSKVKLLNGSLTGATDAVFYRIQRGKLIVKTNRRHGHTLRAKAKCLTNSPPFVDIPTKMKIRGTAD